jgi:hypothetical protein
VTRTKTRRARARTSVNSHAAASVSGRVGMSVVSIRASSSESVIYRPPTAPPDATAPGASADETRRG